MGAGTLSAKGVCDVGEGFPGLILPGGSVTGAGVLPRGPVRAGVAPIGTGSLLKQRSLKNKTEGPAEVAVE